MKFSYYVFVVSAVVIFLLSGNSDGRVTSDLNEIAEVEKIVTNRKYQDKQESIILKSFDKDSKAAKEALEAIRYEQSRLLNNGLSEGGIDLVLDSILTAVRIVSTSERLAYEAFDTALNTADKDPKGAIVELKKSLKSIADLVLTFGVPMEDIFGSALVLSGGSNQEELKRCMSYMQSAGTTVLDALKVAEEIAAMGIEAGGRATSIGIKAAREAVATGGSACFKYHYKGAKYIVDETLNRASKVGVLNKADRLAGVVESLKTPISTSDPAALAAIETINADLRSILSDVSVTQPAKDAAQVLTQSLISTILETADAVAVAKNSFKEAGLIANQDVQAAVNALQKGIEVAKNEIVHGCSVGFLGFGAARQITDGALKIDGLISPMLELILGRISAFNDLKLAQEVALMGIRSGAVDQGINGAIQICEAAENVLFSQFIESASIGLGIFRRM